MYCRAAAAAAAAKTELLSSLFMIELKGRVYSVARARNETRHIVQVARRVRRGVRARDISSRIYKVVEYRFLVTTIISNPSTSRFTSYPHPLFLASNIYAPFDVITPAGALLFT